MRRSAVIWPASIEERDWAWLLLERSAMGRLTPGYTLLILLLLPHHATAADVTAVLARMRRAVEPGGDMRAGVELVVTNAHGERVRWQGEFYRIDGANPRKRLVLESPDDLRGVSVTVQRVDTGADRYRIYLPFVRRVQEIEADQRGEPFLGTDFNYEDLGLEKLEFEQHSLRSEDQVAGRPCYRVESIPARHLLVRTHRPLHRQEGLAPASYRVLRPLRVALQGPQVRPC